MRAWLGSLTCNLVGHHPDGLTVAPVGFTVDGDFAWVEILECARCGMYRETWCIVCPIPIWAREG